MPGIVTKRDGVKGFHLRTSTSGGTGGLRDKAGWFIYPFFGIHMLMGTFRLPPRGQWPGEYGVMKLDSVPRGFWAQARMPLSRRKAWDDFVGRDDAG